MKQLKIQIITNLFPSPWQPTKAVFNYQQFKHLAGLCQLKILVLIPWLEYFKHRNETNTVKLPIDAEVSYGVYFYFPKIGRFLYPFFLLPTLLAKYYKIKREKPDCLLLSWAYPDAVAGIILSKILKVPAIIKVHGSDINMHCLYPIRVKQIVWAMNQAEAVISVSADLARKMTELGVPENKIKVIYNGVDKSIFSPVERNTAKTNLGLALDRKILLYIGNLKKEKGCLDLLNAFSSVAKRDASVDLYYLGSGKLLNVLQAKVDELGLSDKVKILGPVKHKDLPDWINASHSVVLPSYNEGVPNVLLEAMACGIPVVGTRVGGIPEVVPSDAGILVDVGDENALDNALSAVIQNTWDTAAITKSVETFTWEKNVLQLEQLFKSVC